MTMNTNFLGGVAALAALGAILYFGNDIGRSLAPAPQTHVVTPAKEVVPGANTGIVPPNFKPLPPAESKMPEPPKPEPKKPEPPKAVTGPAMIYNRVERDGAKGSEVKCSTVTPFADGKSPAELAAIAKQYEVSVEKLKGYFVCTE